MPHLRPIWELHGYALNRRYVEPFCGGLALPLAFTPQNALLNDTNPHLINFYHWLQRGLRVEIDMENDSALYYYYRTRFNQFVRDGAACEQPAAEMFYYLNHTCFNGLCRFNRLFGRLQKRRILVREIEQLVGLIRRVGEMHVE